MSEFFTDSTCDPVLTRQSLLQANVSTSQAAAQLLNLQTTVSSPPEVPTLPSVVSLAVFLTLLPSFVNPAVPIQLRKFPATTTIVLQSIGGVPSVAASLNPIIAMSSTGNRFFISPQGVVTYGNVTQNPPF
jgi:hypothetical protein